MQIKDSELRPAALARAQATSLLQNIALTLLSNVAIAVSLALLIYLEHGGTIISSWLAAAVAFALVRAWWILRMKSSGMLETDPQRVLRSLTVAAFLSGLLWSVVPLCFGAFLATQTIYCVVFIMAGTTTGAIIQSLAYSPPAIAFGAPLMGATLSRMLMSGSGVSYIIALDVLFLTLMLFRAARVGERGFIASQVTAFEATDLASSLAEANSEVLHSNRALERLVRTDALTGLANRSHFRDVADAACSAGRGVAFLLFDIDNFKTINDTRGHEAGDRVLAAVADVLRSSCEADDLPVRLGGDEFIVVFQGRDVEERAIAFAERLSEGLLQPLAIAGQPQSISCSIGIAAHLDGDIDVEVLCARADAALYRAKEDGRACIRVFDAQMQIELALQRCLDLELPQALARGELHLEFQPQVVMATREVIGFEALLRWRHPRVGMIPPPEIVRAAVRLRLSDKLTSFVAERACAFVRALDASHAPNVKVGINVSPREFSIHSPATILNDAAQRYGIDPRRIEIEITEEAMFDPKRCAQELELIHAYGFGLAIDDFGVGHSSISNLVALELDTIKIDRSFVHGLTTSCRNQQLITAITAVALPLGHRIIAEGVETEEEARLLRTLGCIYGQGWLYGRPMVDSDAIAWLTCSQGSEVGADAVSAA
ncbi:MULTISPECIES: putative bifunctional diguanylate cyclase/phosphodiesterase [unclassified Bradyrhizobium]|uniref:putative bifunctional diguanylate cyclase/phosphodiesterase n=1 Tax=unclassified Bradyrhizobium TaxID=2631580 RepID=UPI002916B3C6|nr:MULTISPECIES: EAL domain-containing protein [unclassified Bradyrhizobium]